MHSWQFFFLMAAIYVSPDVFPGLRVVFAVVFTVAGVLALIGSK